MEVFAEVMEKGVTPVTVLVGLLGNVLSICVLRKKEIQVRWYSHIQMMSTKLLTLFYPFPSQSRVHATYLPLVRLNGFFLFPPDTDVILHGSAWLLQDA